jgi:6-phosphogluconolactonase (cycloisomerase 2 family)
VAAKKTVLYAAVAEQLVQYDADIAGAALTRKTAATLPGSIQYCWASSSNEYVYIASSNRKPGEHYLNAFKIDQTSGALTPNGKQINLPDRPINITLDKDASHVLVVYNETGTAEVYSIAKTGELGEKVAQPSKIDAGIYPHQVRVTPAGDMVIICGRGNDATATKPEDLGSLNIFSYKDGVLTPKSKYIAPAGLGPRHLDFHPTKPWVYIAYERGNRLMMYTLKDGTLSKDPSFIKETLTDPKIAKEDRQLASAIHMDPSGKFLYVSNRCDATVKDPSTGQLSYRPGAVNNIAVYSINQDTGEPTLIQSIDSGGVTPRTFNLDPSGKLLVVSNMGTKPGLDEPTVGKIPNNLAVFKIGSDGKLEFVRKYEFDKTTEIFWTYFASLGK